MTNNLHELRAVLKSVKTLEQPLLDDDPNQEEFFHFGDIETVFDGDKIPFFGGWTKRKE